MQMNQQTPSQLREVFLTGTGQTDLVPSHRAGQTTHELLYRAAVEALNDAGLTFADLDGLAISSFTLAPDHSIDLAVRWNIKPQWLMDSCLGGASGNDMIQHALQAISSGSAQRILVVSGDHFAGDDFKDLVENYNVSARTNFAQMPGMSPNTLFAMLTSNQMRVYGLTKSDYGSLVVRQRDWAAENPHAAYRKPLSLTDYLSSPVIADPLSRYDCVPVVSGASAIVLSIDKADKFAGKSVRVLSSHAQHNPDNQDSDGLSTGLAQVLPKIWQQSGYTVADIDVLSVYDDYPAIVIAQLMDIELLPKVDVSESLARLLASQQPCINSSGGQLSAGQAGAGAGLQGVVEVARALTDQGPVATRGSRVGLVCGYGMVTYRYGSCSNATILERS